MTKSSARQVNANWLLGWMIDRQSDVLPRLTELGSLMPEKTDGYGAHDVLKALHVQGRISWRSGTVSEARGHQAVKILPSGRVLKTEGCPFEPPL